MSMVCTQCVLVCAYSWGWRDTSQENLLTDLSKEGYCARKSSPTRSETLEGTRRKKLFNQFHILNTESPVLAHRVRYLFICKVFTMHSGLVWHCSSIKMIRNGISDNWDCAIGAQRIESSRCIWRQWRVETVVLSVAVKSECLIPVWPHCLLVIASTDFKESHYSKFPFL